MNTDTQNAVRDILSRGWYRIRAQRQRTNQSRMYGPGTDDIVLRQHNRGLIPAGRRVKGRRADNPDSTGSPDIKRCKLTIRQYVFKSFTDTDFIRKGRKVYLHVGAHAEYFLDAATVEIV